MTEGIKRMKTIKTIRKILWQIGIVKNCPLCCNTLDEIGHTRDEGWQYYRCSNPECNFGKDEKSKIVSSGE